MDVTCVGASIGPVEQSWTSTDTILYALGVGAGDDDPTQELAFTTEHSTGVPQAVLPTFPVVVAARLREIYRYLGDVDWSQVVHGEQSIAVLRPLTPDGSVQLTTRIASIHDKGSGALVELESIGRDPESGTDVFVSRMGLFIRGAGGWGGERGPDRRPWASPGAPTAEVRQQTRPSQALLYRLSGDRNPLHSDPEAARRAGFSRPILHGLCTFGFAGRALLMTACGGDPAQFGSMTARFSRPVQPGDALTTRVWLDPQGDALFDVVLDDGREVLSQGRFQRSDYPK
jgi:acyl dehydratase